MTKGTLPGKHSVAFVRYQRHTPVKDDAIPSFKVTYYSVVGEIASEWICLEHEGFARRNAMKWWAEHTGWAHDDAPSTIEHALRLAKNGVLLQPIGVEVEFNSGYVAVKNRIFAHPKIYPGLSKIPAFPHNDEDFFVDDDVAYRQYLAS